MIKLVNIFDIDDVLIATFVVRLSCETDVINKMRMLEQKYWDWFVSYENVVSADFAQFRDFVIHELKKHFSEYIVETIWAEETRNVYAWE